MSGLACTQGCWIIYPIRFLSRSEMCRLGMPGVPGVCRRIIVIYSFSFPQRPKRYTGIHISYFPRIRIYHSRMIAIEKYTLLLPFPGKHHNILTVNVGRLNSLAEYLYCIELIFYCDIGH